MPKTGASRLSFLSGGGEMGERMRAFDWSTSPVGPPAQWPESLKTAVSICIGSRYPIVLWWGHPEYTMFYNDGYIPVLGVTKHPGWLGRSGRECWKEIWSTVGPMLDGVFETGVATWSEDLLLVMNRNLPREEVYFTFSYSPIHGDGGNVDGIFCACYETTARVIGERRLQTLRELSSTVMEVKSSQEACEAAARTLNANLYDVPFSLMYLLDDEAQEAILCGTSGLEAGSVNNIPERIDMNEAADSVEWPFRRVFETGSGEVVTDLEGLPGGAWSESPTAALVLPITAPGYAKPVGFIVTGFSPRRVIDADYRSFFDMIAGNIGTAISNARAYQEERKRAEALAEIDRAKTEFFSNVSHEFRTPLTLMLGPLEDTLGEHWLLPRVRDKVNVAYRNSLRLLKLVNTLLDFSRIEAGRIEAVYEPVDLAALTRDLASVFRSAIEKAGLNLFVHCSPLQSSVYVDREMWEKIVFNLLSNAFKFTFEGEIKVTLREVGANVELEVSDTGTGIPAADLPHLFERFHRVKGAHGRSYEGSGIGLALVQELVKLHGGEVRVASALGKGSVFTITIPTGLAHLPADRIGAVRSVASTGFRSEAYVEEVSKWSPDIDTQVEGLPMLPASQASFSATQADGARRARVLIADDNVDMREYLQRLLGTRYEVETVADGEAALGLARLRDYDLILSDVMMPQLDGFGLLKALRGDERTQNIPVILLSARAGEESRVVGMGAGADDYLVKPFSARELLARVEAHVNLQRVRRNAEQALMQMMEREQKARATAEVANRVKDDFLAMLSHELRTPLNAIIGWSHLLKSGKLSEKDRDRGIDVIDRNAAAQREIIDELLDVSRIVTGKLKLDTKAVELADVIEAAVDAIRPAAEAKGIQVVTSLERNAGFVDGEAVRLQQVVWNLLSNAVKFTPQQGRIDVNLSTVGEDVKVVISDTGDGIEPEFLPFIFERFRQADSSSKRTHGGLGLGLSIVRSLVEMHSGEIHAASDGKGKGATFTLTLPKMAQADSGGDGMVAALDVNLAGLKWKPNGNEASELQSDFLRGLKVLTVDDQQDTRELIALALGRYGAEVRASDSASHALEIIKDWKPHVVVSDIGLPEMDGYDFMRRLREIEGDGERIPAIAVTGYAGALDESKALDAGYALHLSKPIELSALATAIAKVSRKS